MASTSSRIQIIFDGAVDGLRRAVRQAEQDLNRLNAGLERNQKSLDTFTRVSDRVGSATAAMVKGFLALGGAASGIQAVVAVVATLATVTAQLAPAALALPGIILGIGVAYGTVKLALSGFTDAVKGDAEALAKLAPAAQKAVGAVRGLEGGFTKLKQAVQEDFFAGLAIEIKETGTALLDVGQKSLPNVAAGFNAMAVEALRAARTPFFKGALTNIIDNTATALFNMKGTLANVLTGFVGLGSIGSKYLPAIGKAIDDVAAKFAAWVDKGINDKSIERMIDRAIQGFKDLGRTLANVFSAGAIAVRAFNDGFGGEGGTIASLKQASQALLDFVNQPAVQEGLRTLGDLIRTLSDNFKIVLKAALDQVLPIFKELAPFIKTLSDRIKDSLVGAINTVGPYLRDLAKFLSDNKDAIADLVPFLLPAAAGFLAIKLALKGITGLAALSTAITAIRTALGAGLAARLGAVAAAVGRFLWPVAAFAGLALFAKYIDEVNIAAAGGDPEKLDGMADSLHNLVGAGEQLLSGDFSGILADIGVEWDTLVQKFQSGESPAGAAFAKIRDSFQRDFLDVFSGAFTKIADSFQRDFIDFFANLPTTISTSFESLKTTISTKATEAWQGFKDSAKLKIDEAVLDVQMFPERAAFALGFLAESLRIKAVEAWQGFKDSAKLKIDEAVLDVQTLPERIATVLSTLAATLGLKAVEAWLSFQTSAQTKMDEIVAFVTALPGRIGAALAALPGILIKAALDAWLGFFGETQSGGQKSVTETGTVPGKTGTAINPIISILIEKATAAWQGWLTAQLAKIATILADVRAFPGKAVAAIGNTATLLVAAGRDFITGFGNGITSAAGAVMAKIRSVVASFIAGAKAAAGIQSPSTKMIPVGVNFLAGMGVGFDREAPNLIRSISSTVDAMIRAGRVTSRQAAFDASRSGPSPLARIAAAAGGGGVGDIRVFIGNTELTDMITTEIDERDRTTARLVSAGRR